MMMMTFKKKEDREIFGNLGAKINKEVNELVIVNLFFSFPVKAKLNIVVKIANEINIDLIKH